MWPVNLSPPQRPAYLRAVSGDQYVVPSVELLRTSSTVVYDRLGPKDIDEWQVNLVNGDDGIRRTLQLSLAERRRLDRKSLLRVYANIWVDELGEWAKVPQGVFWPSAPSDGLVSSVEAQDKMSLHVRNSGWATVEQGENIVEALRSRLEAMGETRFDFPAPGLWKQRVSKDVAYGWDTDETDASAWQKVAGMGGWVFEYDALGRAALRRKTATPLGAVWDHSMMRDPLSRSRDLTTIRNWVYASGKGVTYLGKGLDRADPNSGYWLQFGGEWWWNVHQEQTELGEAALRRHVETTLGKVGAETVDASFAGVPMWHVDPDGACEVADQDGVPVKFRLDTASWGPGASSVGYLSAARKAQLASAWTLKRAKSKKKRRR